MTGRRKRRDMGERWNEGEGGNGSKKVMGSGGEGEVGRGRRERRV